MFTVLDMRLGDVLPLVQADGYQPVTDDPQISTVSIAVPANSQSGAAEAGEEPGQAAPGAMVNVAGVNLGPSAQSSGVPFARSLADTFVAVEGVRAPLVTTSAGQIELQIPGDLPPGTANVTVSVAGEMSNTFTVGVQPAVPVILAVVHGSDGSAVSASDPAVAGEFLAVYMGGLGAVNTDIAFGAAAPSIPLALTTVTPQAWLGSAPAFVTFSGLSPGSVGLYQVTVQLPSPLPQAGLANLTVGSGSAASSMPIALAAQ